MNTQQARAKRPTLLPEGLDTQSVLWLLLMCLMLVLLLLPFASYVAAISFIKDEWGLNNTQAGTIYSAYLAGYALSALLVIPLTDRLNSKYIITGAAAISVVSHVLFSLVAQSMASGAVLMALAGVGLVGVYMPCLRVISERYPTHGRGMAMGLFVTAFYAAFSVSLAVTGRLMDHFEWRDAYLVMAVASVASLPLTYLLLRNHVHTAAQRSSGRLNLAVLRNRAARYFILGYSLHALELYAVRVWLPVFLASALVARGNTTAQAAVTAATVGGIALAVGAAGPVMGGIISDRWGRATSAAAIFALSGICSWTIGLLGDFPWAIIVAVAVVYGWAIAADSAIYSTAVTEVASPSQLGSTMAMQAFLGFMGGVIGPILVGAVLDISPDSLEWGVGFSFVGLISVVGVASMLRLRLLPKSEALPRGDPAADQSSILGNGG